MKTLLILFIISASSLFAQHNLYLVVHDKATREPLVGANISIAGLNTGATSDENGTAILNNIPTGSYRIDISFMGYKSEHRNVSFDKENTTRSLRIFLEPVFLPGPAIKVNTTRTNGILDEEPVRVEVLGSEEVREETAIKPGNISKLLGETSGIQIQQTSATSGNVSFRIQGLEGRYTQLLKDGFPLYSGFSSGLSLLQIPPLDLLQVEVIKGSTSALYGGDAIAGIVNIITKRPTDQLEWNTIINATHKKGTDFSTYYSNLFGKWGVTMLMSHSRQSAFDVDHDGYSDIPQFTSSTINPKIFYYFDKHSYLNIGLITSLDDRSGGDIFAIQNGPDNEHSFIDKNKTNRLLSRAEYHLQLANGDRFTVKNSLNRFTREISVPGSLFKGKQFSTYNEISYLTKRGAHTFISGINFITDQFRVEADSQPATNSLNYSFSTPGIYLQDGWEKYEQLRLHASIRADLNNKYGLFLLPHISLLYKYSGRLRGRISIGSGYKLPTLFTAEAESGAFKNVRPFTDSIAPESSVGMSLDMSYKFFMGQFLFMINPVVYATRIDHYIAANEDSLANDILFYQNNSKSLFTKGFETNLKISLDELVLFVDYTLTRVNGIGANTNRQLDLTPKQKLNLTLTIEEENAWRTGLEVFYTGKQRISPDQVTPDFWTVGIMAQKLFKNFILIANVENVFDVRQSRYETVVQGDPADPIFRPVWAPLDGIVANIALEITL